MTKVRFLATMSASMLLLMASSAVHAKEHNKCHKSQPGCSQGIRLITACDINSACSPSGYVITKPGTYCLSENVDWKNSKPNSFAITIASDNVVLLLNDYTITQRYTNVSHNFAIQIANGVKAVEIQGGILQSLSGGGIWARGNNQYLSIKGLRTINCGYLGQTTIQNLFGTPTVSAGILFDGFDSSGNPAPISDVEVRDCSFHDTGTLNTQYDLNGSVMAVVASGVSNISIVGCTVNGLLGDSNGFGLAVSRGKNGLITNNFITNIVAHSLAKGVWSIDFSDLQYQDCTVEGITLNIIRDFGPSRFPGAEGSKIHAASNVTVQRVNFSNIKVNAGPYTVGAGFGLRMVGLLMPAPVALVSAPQNVLVEDCTVTDLLCTVDPSFVTLSPPVFSGFIVGGPNTVMTGVINRCTAGNIQAPLGPIFGFSLFSNGPVSLIDSIAENVVITDDLSATNPTSVSTAAGIRCFSVNGEVRGCEVSNILATPVVLPKVTKAYGIWLPPPASGWTISNNRVLRCTTAGIIDESAAKNNTVTGTYAAFNGVGGPVPSTNYVNLKSPDTPYQDWAVGSPPAAITVGGLVNVDRHNP